MIVETSSASHDQKESIIAKKVIRSRVAVVHADQREDGGWR